MARTFEKVKGLHPRRSFFNLSMDKVYNCDMGQLIPSYMRFMVPGDIFRVRQQIVVRSPEPLRSPAVAEINVHSYGFFIPLRILMGENTLDENGWNEWEIHDHDFEKFITGRRVNNTAVVSLPRWIPTGEDVVNDNWNGIEPEYDPDTGAVTNGSNLDDTNVTVADNGKYSLWDYMGYPIDIIPQGAYPLDFKRRAYNMIWNEWMRDESVMPPVRVDTSNIVLNCCWKKDYFTSMLPWPQKGDPIAIPMRGNAAVDLNFPAKAPVKIDQGVAPGNLQLGLGSGGVLVSKYDSENVVNYAGSAFTGEVNNSWIADLTGISGTAALTMAATFTVNDLRLAFQIQRWQELMARTGSRYVEYLKAMYGTSPTDDTLQRPMFIGGSKSPVIISEVLQTSTGDSGVGSMSGHAISADANQITKFRANEFGLLMVLTVIKPKAMYQQGIEREDLYESNLEFYNPAMVNLGEQATFLAEIYAQNTGNRDSDGDHKTVGFQGRFNELRSAQSQVCGGLRDELSYWVQSRVFASAPELNGQFLKCNPSKNIFRVQDEPSFVVFVHNDVKAFRPLPVDAQPGLIDHLYGERRS